jgi:ABC-2 type transport system ATP-binding protein
MIFVDVKNITKHYGPLKALNDISLQVKKGEIYGLLGPNGSGKTTMIKCLTGQIKPTQGTISVLNIDVIKNSIKIREFVGIIPEQENPPSFLTAEEYLHFVANIRDLKNAAAEIDHWFSFLEFEDQRTTLCKDLSRGTRQKLMFAQAFMHKPKLAFIDEPLINLDPVVQKKIKDFLKQYTKDGNTIFISTHILEIAEELCDNICILSKGKLVYQGKPKKNLESFFISSVSHE